ncbi:MAG: RNA polymerase sigma factor [Vicinamibacterales bacterium]
MSPPPASTFAAPAPGGPEEEARWFKEEVQPHERDLRSYLQRRFPSLSEVDDVVQDSYIRILRARFQGNLRSARSYLFKVAHNLACDLFRHRQVVTMEPLADHTSTTFASEADGAESAMLRQELDFLTAALQEVPQRSREVLILRRIHGLSHKEIAAQLNISEHTVEKHVGIGLKRCMDYMRRKGVTPSP